jgi:hypothetical protein
MGVAADAAGLSPTVEPVPVSPPDGASIPNAKWMFPDLENASPKQIGAILACMTDLIGIYSDAVANASERYRKDCELLANVMAEFTRICHFIARRGADALEANGDGLDAPNPDSHTHGDDIEGRGES